MKRLMIIEVDVLDLDELRAVARAVGYAAWAALDDDRRPAIKVARSAEATMALRSAWETLGTGT